MKHHLVFVALCAIGLVVANPRASATTLLVELPFTGDVNHNFRISMLGNGYVTDSPAVSPGTITGDLNAYDEITFRATLPAGLAFLLDPHDSYTPPNFFFSWYWLRDTPTIPGGATQYATSVTFLGASGAAPTQTEGRSDVRNEGASIQIGSAFSLSADPFTFTGIEATITGPFPANGGMPLLPSSFSTSFSSGFAPNPPGDPGPIITVIPEPGSLALLGVGGLLIARRRNRATTP